MSPPDPPAPLHHLPKQPYTAIEYPGPVSHPAAILAYASQHDINACFNAPPPHPADLQLRFRGDAPGPPLRGYCIPSQKLLMKIVKRRRKPAAATHHHAGQGVFRAEMVGTVNHTVRFVSMADYQWTPDPNGPTASLINSLKALDYNAILNYSFPPLAEEYIEPHPDATDQQPKFRSKLDLQPLPIFSTRNLPAVYNFKMPPQVVPVDVPHPITGRIRTRFANNTREHGLAPHIIQHDHTLGDVPREPNVIVQGKMSRLNQDLLQKLRQAFEKRPVWVKQSLLAQFSEEEQGEMKREKAYFPSVAYVINTGVYSKCLVKYGYDPRLDIESRKLQHIFFYAHKKTVKNPMNTHPENDEEADRREGWWEEEQARLIAENKRPPIDPTKANIFDGQYLHKAKADYQLCDITDPFIMRYIDDTKHLSTICTLKSGWYTFSWITLIKALVRAKYMYMLETGLPAPDAICNPVLEEYGKGKMDGAEDAGGRGRRGGAASARGSKGGGMVEEQEDSVDSGEAEAEEPEEDNEDEGDRDGGLDNQDKGDDDL
ncbi:general transcription factor 3C polypeptide 5 (transcription factor C subunit 1) [Cryptococcus bacillisporus CA1873]|uniref:General transcription factor 3C polypeptide 5 (Transcription factor C subunit 1) n=1 Tax=Cryptococcus bacillisporus CA1873 TaxID=1296111 RepID=A0ABR5B958_CRYGA|nr:general transcription factor 3C polypeptide 5 (transcription factor C subunit 1) [Cryptococcus bacillisporus CA1873]|eukprot:KIR59944.1 general transcription factor 3C polypeptide 5 (transcription factor C subunit 1) [Cryptococcus gattii CA1873]